MYVLALNCSYLIPVLLKIKQYFIPTPNIYFLVVSMEKGYYKIVPSHNSMVGVLYLKVLSKSRHFLPIRKLKVN
jgi:hypothetical protein